MDTREENIEYILGSFCLLTAEERKGVIEKIVSLLSARKQAEAPRPIIEEEAG